ncbi:hypothetical protein RAC89_08815 [Paenibacillus sp. GD4]|uniref:hypothetical protein n=1 Tax=Paenibacillus sp. GD4 TaxID=3068890 RepID=UPI002796C4E9|nr:hypothetical protein [Paenibacillus sp. GD4]MDQ1910601.1 hypothetical protein [Paenibacillus sp. GD4]
MGVSRSGYYKWLNRKPSEQEKLRKKRMKRIQHHFYAYKRRYGSDKIATNCVKKAIPSRRKQWLA